MDLWSRHFAYYW